MRAIAVAVFVQNAGSASVLPLLPLYLRRQHTSVGLVGVVMAAYFAAAVLTQYAAGHVSDRVGHRRVMTGGLALFSLASLAFLLPVGPGGYVVLRALQGVGAGAFQIAGLAFVGVVIPLERRGRAFSAVFAAQLSGLAAGPVLGAAAGVGHMDVLFAVAAAAAAAATVPTLTMTPAVDTAARVDEPRVALRMSRPLVGVILVGAIGGLCTGVYETCWSLLMTSKHAAQWQVGLSWTLFATSFALFSPIAGRLADRHDRRVLALLGLTAWTGFLVVYPWLPSPAWLMALGVAEAIGVAVAFPAAQSLLSQCVPPEALGRAQGLFATAESAAIAAMAGAAGYLFAVTRWLPFVVGAALAGTLTLWLPSLWRGLAGRVVEQPVVLDEPLPELTPSL